TIGEHAGNSAVSNGNDGDGAPRVDRASLGFARHRRRDGANSLERIDEYGTHRMRMLECGGDASERRRTVAQARDAQHLVGAGERAVFDGSEIVNEIELRATEPSRDRTPQHTLRRENVAANLAARDRERARRLHRSTKLGADDVRGATDAEVIQQLGADRARAQPNDVIERRVAVFAWRHSGELPLLRRGRQYL